MPLPFTKAEFVDVFVAYNTAIWPLQGVAAALGLVTIGLLAYRPSWAARSISAILAIFWLVMGVGYHWSFFAAINPAAYLFSGLFIIAALIFLLEGAIRNRIQFRGFQGNRARLASLLIVYGFVLYPLLGLIVTHPYPATPLFGVAPCPTTIFTLALLIIAQYPRPWVLGSIPLVWSLIGGSAALLLDVPADWGLFVAALAWIYVTVSRAASSHPPLPY